MYVRKCVQIAELEFYNEDTWRFLNTRDTCLTIYSSKLYDSPASLRSYPISQRVSTILIKQKQWWQSWHTYLITLTRYLTQRINYRSLMPERDDSEQRLRSNAKTAVVGWFFSCFSTAIQLRGQGTMYSIRRFPNLYLPSFFYTSSLHHACAILM